MLKIQYQSQYYLYQQKHIKSDKIDPLAPSHLQKEQKKPRNYFFKLEKGSYSANTKMINAFKNITTSCYKKIPSQLYYKIYTKSYPYNLSNQPMLSAVCCLTTDFCKGGCIGLSRNQNIKFTYNLIILVVYVIGIFLNQVTQNDKINVQNYKCEDIQEPFRCVEQRKTSLDFVSLSVFHIILMICMISKSKHVKIINQGLWLAKIILIVGLILFYSLLESASSYIQFVMLWGSPLLYCLVNIVIIDLVYSLDISLEQRAQNNNKLYVFKAVFTIIIWLCAIVCNIFSYSYSLEYVAIINSVLLAIFLIIAFLRVSRCNSLLVYAFLGLYFNLIAFNIHSQTDERPRILTSFQHIFRLLVACFLLFGMLFQGGNKLRTKHSTFNQMLALNTSEKQQDNRYVSSNKWTIYHYIMAMICLTLPALIFYDSNSLSPTQDTIFDIGRLAWWITAILLYSWSILCQKIYPEKDFSELQNYFKEYELN